MAYGTKVVAGVTPGRGGQRFEDKVPIFDTVEEAVKEQGADTSCIFVPPPGAADAIARGRRRRREARRVHHRGHPRPRYGAACAATSTNKPVRLIGPNCPGIITPGECKIGIMPGHIHKPGNIGVLSKSGTLTYEAVFQLSALGIGQSTCIGIGGDPVDGPGLHRRARAVQRRSRHPRRHHDRRDRRLRRGARAAWIKANMKKPVAAFIAGRTAPPGKRMGHAGAIISGGKGTAAEKIEALEDAGIKVSPTPADMGKTLASRFSRPAFRGAPHRCRAEQPPPIAWPRRRRPRDRSMPVLSPPSFGVTTAPP